MRLGSRLAVDVGMARVGIARCDVNASICIPVETLKVAGDFSASLDRIVGLVEDFSILEVVVGLPLLLSGKRGEATNMSLSFARRLAKKIHPIPVRLVDERLTSKTARSQLSQAGYKRKDNTKVIDQVAAVLILEHALNMERNNDSPPGELVHL